MLMGIFLLYHHLGTVDIYYLSKVANKYREWADNRILYTSMGITCLYDVLKAPVNDVTKRAVLASFDTVLSLSLLEKAAALREKEAQQAKTASAPGGFTIQGEGDAGIDALVLQRAEAKKAKNFAEADRIRDELKARGIEVTDVPGGAVWKRV